jgi:Flp pilus assembly protein TadG
MILAAREKQTVDCRKRRRLHQSGQATVELALSMGLLLLLLLAAVDFGRAFFAYIGIINAAREGARSGVMTGNQATIVPAVQQEIQGNSLDPARLTVQYNWGGTGQPLTVTVTYRFNLITTGFLPVSELNLRTSTTMALP